MAGKNQMVTFESYKSVAGPLTAMTFRNLNHQRKQEKARELMRYLKLCRESRETDKPQEKKS